MIKPPPDFRKDIKPGKVFMSWDITYKCNYKCSYCHYGGAKDAGEPCETAYPGVERWIEIWKDIYGRYGSCQIHLVGGEPFCYPDFIRLIRAISEIHTWECSTNLFWDPDELIGRISPGRARIGVSYHPEFVSFDEFLFKTRKLKAAGFEVWANYVAYPSILVGMEECKQKFNEIGVSMSILPFRGEYGGRTYPEAFTEEERALLRRLGTEPWTQKSLDFAFDEKQQQTKHKKCRMGQMYAKITPTGDAIGCCTPGAVYLGNVIKGTFALLDEPVSCSQEKCPCWKCMLVDSEEKWCSHWVVPPDGRCER
ncbi:MAG: radical SAM protein [Endomicrobiales bacterium]|nr:radical SAM protein [Endomicrobiales bacterium]